MLIVLKKALRIVYLCKLVFCNFLIRNKSNFCIVFNNFQSPVTIQKEIRRTNATHLFKYSFPTLPSKSFYMSMIEGGL